MSGPWDLMPGLPAEYEQPRKRTMVDMVREWLVPPVTAVEVKTPWPSYVPHLSNNSLFPQPKGIK